MKRYIRASYDSSMPSWLKTEAGKNALERLTGKYAISEAKFSKTPTEGSIPIYLLDEVFKNERRWGETYKVSAGQYVFVPELSWYEDKYLATESSFRGLDKVSKSRLEKHIIDTVYMTAPLRSAIQKERNYTDPRYVKDSNRHLSYEGQYPEYDEHYNDETGKWEPDEEPTWVVPSRGYSGRQRDKSGYEIPDPVDIYSRLYARFPDRLKGRINEAKAILDEYYDKLEEAKRALFSAYDIRKGKSPKYYGESYNAPSRRLEDAIQYYGWVYRDFDACVNDDGSVDPAKLAEFMKSSSYSGASSYLKDIDKDLEVFYKNLR